MTKPALQSVTIWGLIFSALCTASPQLAALLHLTDPSTQSTIETFVGTFGTLISLGVALYGRLHTSMPISGIVSTPASSSGTPPSVPPAAASLVLATVLLGGASLLGGCASTGAAASGPVTASTVLSSITAAVQAHPGQTVQALTDADQAFLVGSEGIEVAYQTGLLKGASVATAKADLETAYGVLSTSRLAFNVAGGVATASLQAANAHADAAYLRVDAELATN